MRHRNRTMLSLVLAPLCVLATWLLLACASFGIGALAGRVITADPRVDLERAPACCWLGVATLVLMLQVAHFFVPVTGVLLGPIAAFGLIGARGARRMSGSPRVDEPAAGARWPLAASICLVGWWLANRALAAPAAYDSGMYHIPAIEWFNAYAVVPGLGNLHGRFAFNNSNLLLAALLDVGPWDGRSRHLLGGFFLFLFVAQACTFIGLRHGRPHGRPHARRARLAFHAVLLVPAAYMALDPNFVASLGAELPVAALLFAAASFLVQDCTGVEDARRGGARAVSLGAAMLLCTVAACFKLSAAAVGLLLWILCARALLKRPGAGRAARRSTRRAVLVVAAASSVLIASWVARGIVLSGYALYPSTLVAAPVEWRLPVEQARAEAAWIAHSARTYHDPSLSRWGSVERYRWSGFEWLPSWLRGTVEHARPRWQIALPTAIVLTAVLCLALRRRVSGSPTVLKRLWLAPGAGILFWFFAAPRPDFGFFAVWLGAAIAAGQALAPISSGLAFRAGLAGLLLVASVPAARSLADPRAGRPAQWRAGSGGTIFGGLLIRPARGAWFTRLPTPRTGAYVTRSGLHLRVPIADNRCVRVPLCTPHPAPNLRLRRPGDLPSGFVVDGEWQPRRWPNPWATFLPSWRRARRPPREPAGPARGLPDSGDSQLEPVDGQTRGHVDAR